MALAETPPTFMSRLRDASPWWYMAALLLPGILFAGLSAAFPAVWTRFVEPYFWAPLAHDLGFNPFNTMALVYACVVLIAWFHALMRAYDQRPDGLLTIVVVAFFVWGSMLRVLEDADFFAPFSERQRAAGVLGNDPCSPGLGSLLESCFGVVFVTPLLWIWIAVLVFLLCRLALGAEQVGDRLGKRAGLRFYALTLAAFVALHTVTWAAQPRIVRFVPHPLFGLVAAGLAFGLVWFVHRHAARLRWRWAALGYVMHLLVLTATIILSALVPPRAGWGEAPYGEQRIWVLLALVVAPTTVVLALRGAALLLAKIKRGGSSAAPRAWLAYGTLIVAAFTVATVIGLKDLLDDGPALGPGLVLAIAGPATAVLVLLATRQGARRIGGDPLLGAFAEPMAVLIVWAQIADAYMTSLALDVYQATEKHVVPRGLIALVESWDLPSPFGAYPAAVVMIPLKLVVSAALVWLLAVRMKPDAERYPALFWLIGLAAIAVGLGPAVRDALRMMLGV